MTRLRVAFVAAILIVASLPEASELALLGVQDQDVILKCDDKVIDNIADRSEDVGDRLAIYTIKRRF